MPGVAAGSGATTFWLARSGVSRRPSERPVAASNAIEATATSASPPPIQGCETIRTLAPSPRTACHACASAQLGRHQNVSIVAARP